MTGGLGAASFPCGPLGPAPGLSSTGGSPTLGLHVMSATGPTGCCVSHSPGQASGRAGATALRHLSGPREDSVWGFQAAPGSSALSHALGHWVPHVHARPSPHGLTLWGGAKLTQDVEANGGRPSTWFTLGGADSLEATPGFRRVQGKQRGLYCGLSSLWPWRRWMRRKPPDSGAVAALFDRSF